MSLTVKTVEKSYFDSFLKVVVGTKFAILISLREPKDRHHLKVVLLNGSPK